MPRYCPLAVVRFKSLHIRNFRAISEFEIGDLATMVVIACLNGCGKSSVFDAARLLKSAYGGYQGDEWQSWFGEFQINLTQRSDLVRVFRDSEKAVEISAELALAPEEIDYLRANAEAVLEPLAWKEVLGREIKYGSPGSVTELRVHGPRVREIIESAAGELREGLARPLRARLAISPELDPTIEGNRVLETIFQTFDPQQLGIIDYHGPMRTYQREALGGLNLNLEDFEQRRLQHSLYNWQSKYANVKSELAATYIRELIARDAGVELEGSSDLNQHAN